MNTPTLMNADIVNVTFGENVRIIRPTNIYGCKLCDGVFIGPFCEIQKNVAIGKRTRVQSHSFICEYVEIGRDNFIGHGVMFVNDLFKQGAPSESPDDWKRTIIADNVSIGSNTTILPVNICSKVVIGAGSVVTKNIVESGIYTGNPAKKLRDI